MRTSIATVSVSGTLEQKLTAIAAAGYDAVEIFEPDLLSCAASPREIARRIEDLGLTCALYQPFRDFEGMPGELRQRAFDRAERKFDVMAELGTERVLFCSNCSPHALGEHDRIVDDFRALGERAAARGVLIGYEALAWGRHVYDHRQAWQIVKAVDHPAIGILLDSFHSLSRDIPNESLAEIDPAKIVFVQLADAPRLSMDLLFWSRHFRCMPGQGDLPVAGFVAELLKPAGDAFRDAVVARDGKTVKTIPISAGSPENKTYEGQMVISEKFKETRMNGATVGFTDDDGQGEYDIKDVPHAMRLSTSGTFIHGNYWGAKSIFGGANTSHGCVGLSDTKGANDPNTPGAWFYDNSMVGDVVVVQNTGDKTIAPDNGLNGWNMDWAQWKAGSAL